VHAVGVFVVDGEVVEDMPEMRGGPGLAPAEANAPDRVSIDALGVAEAQLITSRLWTCCSQMWSPESQVK